MDVAPGSVVEPGWLLSPEGRRHRDAILRKDRRRAFGLLERPALLPPPAAYKLFVSGKSGVGKTALVAALAGADVPPAHRETLGIQATSVYWPAKLRDSDCPVLFRLDFWDCGEASLRKFDHILPACKEEADGILFLFSFTDRSSFEDLPAQMARVTRPEENLLRVVVGTKFDQAARADVAERDVAAFERAWRLPVLRARSVPRPPGAAAADLAEVAPLLDALVERLWRRDQEAAGLLPVPSASGSPSPRRRASSVQ
ncbi:ciliogenesis and planar polarity effector 2 [Rhea pennata]|uniref:ciliogenesis and planar polarity effector 2 n=1 Tax=Rhea pennata TaxID=8795 RepID=UPI002E26B470